LFFVYAGLGLGFSLALLIKSMFIMGVSSVVGSVSGLPGGLGTADGSMLGLTRLLITPSAAIGGAATLLIRLCTLWFGLGLGVIALLLYRTTQRIDHSSDQGERLDIQKLEIKNRSPEDAGPPDSQAVPASPAIGDKVV
jgi:uncharacterized membrane protein YbhN (UPF0104 family)